MNLFARLTNNLWLKVLSIVLALVMSIYVIKVVDPIFTQNFTFPLELQNLNESLVVSDPHSLPEQIRIKVTGKYSKVRQLPGRRNAIVNLEGLDEPGVYNVNINAPEVGDVQVTYQDISHVRVILDEKITVTKPIEIDRQGEVDEHYNIGEENLSHHSVEITGPRPVVERISVVQVEPDVSGVTQDIRRTMLPIKLYDKNDFQITNAALVVRPAQVRYAMELVPIASIKVLKVYPSYQGRLPEDLLLDKLIANPQTIPVDAELVEEGVFAVTTTPIDLTNVTESFTTTVDLIYPFTIPEGVRLPHDCRVSVQLLSFDEIGAKAIDVELVNKREGFDYIVTPPEIAIRSETLTPLESDDVTDIVASLDVADLGAGEHRLIPQVHLPLGLRQVKIDPESVQVTIIPSGEQQ
ncbi:hypothetical protein JW859_12540 [bacterium]|nr:hypothetical protein [bacterium]